MIRLIYIAIFTIWGSAQASPLDTKAETIAKALTCHQNQKKITVKSYESSYHKAISLASSIATTLIKSHNIEPRAVSVIGYKSKNRYLEIDCKAF